MKNNAPSHRPTACFVTHLPTYLHFSSQGDHGYSNFVPHTSVERVVNVSRVTGRQRAKDDENFARRVSREMTTTLKIQKEATANRAHLILLRAISIAFCKLGSPAGSSFVRSLSDLSTSCGLPANMCERNCHKVGIPSYQTFHRYVRQCHHAYQRCRFDRGDSGQTILRQTRARTAGTGRTELDACRGPLSPLTDRAGG